MSDRPRTAIVVGRFYDDLAERLVAGAQAALAEAGAPPADVLRRARRLRAADGRQALRRERALRRRSSASARSSAARPTTTTTSAPRPRAASRTCSCGPGVPTAFGVLTVDTMDQALARSGGDTRDSGRHAADAVLALLAVRERLASG